MRDAGNRYRRSKGVDFPITLRRLRLTRARSMSLGTAVITSNLSRLPEIAGDAAILVDPYDTHAIASAMREVDCNADLRTEMENKGQRRAGRFSREAYSTGLSGVYETVTAAHSLSSWAACRIPLHDEYE